MEAPEPERDERLIEAEKKWPPHASVDLTADDPARLADGVGRQCIAANKQGDRCASAPRSDGARCNVHSGRLDPRAGGQAKAARLAEERQEARETRIQAKLGPRAALQRQIQADQALLCEATHVLLEAAAGGDLQAAKALPAFLNQALGMPGAPIDLAVSTDNVDALSTAQLHALLGRTAPPSAA